MMPSRFTYNEEGMPESLFALCLKSVARNMGLVCAVTPDGYVLRDGLALPSGICESLVETYQNVNGEMTDQVAHLFGDATRTRLRFVHIRGSMMTDDGIDCLLRHDLHGLTLEECPQLTHKTLINIGKHGRNLQSLTIGSNVSIMPLDEQSNQSPTVDLQLRVLDLSYFWYAVNLQHFGKLDRVHTLILFNVCDLNVGDAILSICNLRSLVVLDISQTDPELCIFENENTVLATLVEGLPSLMSLDISGTNLAGNGTAEYSTRSSFSGKISDIAGLQCRVDNPLEFLGLYDTMHDACRRPNIPAKIISGDANENQYLNAVAASINKVGVLEHLFKELTEMFTTDECTEFDRALCLVLEALVKHVDDEDIQCYGGLFLLSILKNEPLDDITVRRRIVTTLFNGIEYHNYKQFVLGHVCLILSQVFEVPEDIMFEYKRLLQMLTHIVTDSGHEELVLETGLSLLNAVSFTMDNKEIIKFGNIGTINKMMLIIRNHVDERTFEDIFEVAWSIISNLTTEAPINCQRFIDLNGMKYFLECVTIFPDKDVMLWSIMGTLRNVAEVKELRPWLMQAQFLNAFSELSFSTDVGVSFNAAGVIAHLASDGPEAWNVLTLPWQEVLDRMTLAIQNWNPDSYQLIVMSIDFEIFMQLAQVRHTPQCAHWAVFALAQCTKVNPEVFCPKVISKGGLKVMRDLLNDHQKLESQDNQPGTISILAQSVINQCLLFMNQA